MDTLICTTQRCTDVILLKDSKGADLIFRHREVNLDDTASTFKTESTDTTSMKCFVS